MTPKGLPNLLATGRALEAAQEAARRRAHLDLREHEMRQYSLSRALTALAEGKVRSGSFEAEVSEGLIAGGAETNSTNSLRVPLWALRDLQASAGGQFLVDSETRVDSLAEVLRGRSVVATMPITRMPGCVGNVLIPRETAGPTAYVLQSEDSQITASQPTLGQVALTPKNVAALTNVSRTFSTMTGEGGAAYIRRTLLGAVAAKLDALAIQGSGLTGEPLGIISQITGSVSGSSLSEAGVREFQTDIGENLGPDCAFVTTQAVASLLNGRQRFTGSSNSLWEGNLYAGALGGWPAYSSPSVPAAHLIFGAWSSVVLAEWGESIELAVNPYGAFSTGGTQVRVIATFDVGLVRPAAFSVATSVS